MSAVTSPTSASGGAQPSTPGTSGSTRAPYLSIAEQKEKALEKARAAKARKKAKAQAEIQRKKQEALDAEIKRARELSNHRWKDCLSCLQESVPRLKANPWLIILEPTFIHHYLDSLTETLANLSKHEEDLDMVRSVLQDVYEAFVDVGRFAKYQPAFYIQNPYTIKRFVRLLEQVAHRGSDKALFPNVLSLLGPTFEREELYETLGDSRIVHSLMSFVRTDWMPSHATLSLLLAIIEQLSSNALLREMFMEDPGYPKLQALAFGLAEGFSKDQQLQAQQALALYPPPKAPEEAQPVAEGTDQPATAAGAALTVAGGAEVGAQPVATPSSAAAASANVTTPPTPQAADSSSASASESPVQNAAANAADTQAEEKHE